MSMLSVFGKKPEGDRLKRIQNTSGYRDAAFQNESHTPMMAEDSNYWTVMRTMFDRSVPRKPSGVIPAVATDLQQVIADDLDVYWFGHSSYLLVSGKVRILVDPVFSGHASPFPGMVKAFEGTEIFTADAMPDIDVLIITHDHYDHLDYKTVSALRNKVKNVVCSLGVGAHLTYWGYDAARIHELYWHESAEVDNMTFTALPARHFSGRMFTRNQTAWSAFSLHWNGKRIYIGGDSGYDVHFAKTGAQYGPFDLAILECGQYNPTWKYIHMMPEETVQAAIDLRATILMPVHWGKFALSVHSWTEPADRVLQAAIEKDVPMAMPKPGARYTFAQGNLTDPWWREVR